MTAQFLGPSDVRDTAAAAAVAQEIRESVNRPLSIGPADIELTVSTSIGIAIAGDGTDPDELLRNADAALYEAKRSGRNQIATFSNVSTLRPAGMPRAG